MEQEVPHDGSQRAVEVKGTLLHKMFLDMSLGESRDLREQ